MALYDIRTDNVVIVAAESDREKEDGLLDSAKDLLTSSKFDNLTYVLVVRLDGSTVKVER